MTEDTEEEMLREVVCLGSDMAATTMEDIFERERVKI